MQRAYPWLTAILLLGCLLLGYVAVRQKIELRRSVSPWSAFGPRFPSLIPDLQRQLAAARMARQKAQSQIVHLASGSSNPHAPPSTSEIIKEHPEYAAIMARQTRRDVLRQFGTGLGRLNLPPARLERLKELLSEREMSARDASVAAEGAGFGYNSPGWWAAVKQARSVAEQEMTSFLGTDGDEVIRQFQAQGEVQNEVQNTYAPDFADAGASLDPEQARNLAQVLAGVSLRAGDAAGQAAEDRPDPATWLSPRDRRILEAAAQVLTPVQLQILKTDQMQSNQESAIMNSYRNVMIQP